MSDFTLHHEEKFEFLLEGTGPPPHLSSWLDGKPEQLC